MVTVEGGIALLAAEVISWQLDRKLQCEKYVVYKAGIVSFQTLWKTYKNFF